MIAEPGILSTSSWNTDLLLKEMQSDFYKSYVNMTDGLDMGLSMMDYEVDRCRSVQGGSIAAFGSSGSPSSASSDCSEVSLDFVWQPSDSASLHIPDHDYLNSSLNLLDGNGVTVCSEEFDWVGDNFVAASMLDSVDSPCNDLLRTPSCSRPRCSRPVDPVTDTKLWSRMSLEDRLEAVEGLTTIISNQMGLREQLDIIRIIEPSANISATDTEFVIDLNALDDRKLCGVREYVRRVQTEQRAKLENKPTSPTKVTSCSTSGKSGHSKGGHCISNNSSSSSTAGASTKGERGGHSPGKGGPNPGKGGPSLGKGKHSKKEKEAKDKEKRAPPPHKVLSQKRQRKEHRQLLKERRSGLFRKEEVLSLSELPVIEEDEDIDILD